MRVPGRGGDRATLDAGLRGGEGELLYDDPARGLRQARSVEGETASGDPIVARMRGEDWEIEGKSAAEAQTTFEALDALERWRVTGLIAADPEDAGADGSCGETARTWRCGYVPA